MHIHALLPGCSAPGCDAAAWLDPPLDPILPRNRLVGVRRRTQQTRIAKVSSRFYALRLVRLQVEVALGMRNGGAPRRSLHLAWQLRGLSWTSSGPRGRAMRQC